MKVIGILILITAVNLGGTAFGQEAEDPVTPTNRPSPDELRARAKRLTPKEREVALRELRGRLRPGSTNRSELERRRDEWRKLPPAQREARIREFRARHLDGQMPPVTTLTPAERESKRAEIKGRVESQIRELEARRSISELTPMEERRLERFRRMARQLDRGTALGTSPRPDPSGREGKDLPLPRGAPAAPNPPANPPGPNP